MECKEYSKRENFIWRFYYKTNILKEENIMKLRKKLKICYTWHILTLDILKSIKEELAKPGN